MVRHYAFTLIELVFAIVIIAIIVLSIPVMNQINGKAMEGNLAQEAIFITSAKVLQTLTFPWDENSTDAELILEGATVLSGVVKIPEGTESLDFNANICRPGLINRFCRTDQSGFEVNVSELGNDNISPLIRGLDDSNGTFELGSGTSAGYKNKYRTITRITYVSDSEDNATNSIDYNASNPFSNKVFVFSDNDINNKSNLRLLTVSTEEFKDGEWIPVVVLRAYGANIGEIKPYKRTY